MFVNDICVGILRKCNWNCKYCIVSNRNEKIDEDAIFEELYPIRNKLKYLWISGGEPGLLSEQFWSKLVDSIDFNLKICTNGTFIINGLYDKFRVRINQLAIHSVSELTQDIHPKVLELVRKRIPNITFNIVVHKYNVSYVKDFLTKYNDIIFTINFTDETFDRSNVPDYEYVIDREAALILVNQLSSLPNYQTYLNYVVRLLMNKNYDNLNPWSPKNFDPSLK